MTKTPLYLDKITERHHSLARLAAFVSYPFMYSRVRKFIPDKSSLGIDGVSTPWLVYDMLYSRLAFGTAYKLYFCFSFWKRNDNGKSEFYSSGYWRFLSKLGNQSYKKRFDDKYDTYSAYKDFFKRDAVRVTLPVERDAFLDFARSKGQFIVKPIDASQGMGVKVVRDPQPLELDKLLDEMPGGSYIVEELIQQDEGLAVFHPSSVNTIRFATYFDGSNTVRLFAFLRMGLAGQCVDNASAGGVYAGVDIESGIIVTRGIRRNGETFLTHPDTGTRILGYQIPKWDDLLCTVEKIVRVDPSAKLIGWDFALSRNGWCLVEGNASPSFVGYQMSFDCGLAKRLDEILRHDLRSRT